MEINWQLEKNHMATGIATGMATNWQLERSGTRQPRRHTGKLTRRHPDAAAHFFGRGALGVRVEIARVAHSKKKHTRACMLSLPTRIA